MTGLKYLAVAVLAAFTFTGFAVSAQAHYWHRYRHLGYYGFRYNPYAWSGYPAYVYVPGYYVAPRYPVYVIGNPYYGYYGDGYYYRRRFFSPYWGY